MVVEGSVEARIDCLKGMKSLRWSKLPTDIALARNRSAGGSAKRLVEGDESLR